MVPINSDVTERFMALRKQRDLAYRLWNEVGLTRDQQTALDALETQLETQLETLYPQLPVALRDSWEN